MSPKGAEPWESRCQQIQRSVIFTGAHSKDVWSLESEKSSLDQHVSYCRRNYCIRRRIWNPNSLDIELWKLQLADPFIKDIPVGLWGINFPTHCQKLWSCKPQLHACPYLLPSRMSRITRLELPEEEKHEQEQNLHDCTERAQLGWSIILCGGHHAETKQEIPRVC